MEYGNGIGNLMFEKSLQLIDLSCLTRCFANNLQNKNKMIDIVGAYAYNEIGFCG